MKLIKVTPPPHQWLGISGVSNSQTCLYWASSNSSIILQAFLLWQVQVSALGGCDSPHPPSTSPIQGQQFSLWPYFSHGSIKNSWFFCLISILFIRMEQWLLNSLHVGLEAQSPYCKLLLTPLKIRGEITPERMKGWSQSKNNSCGWVGLVIEARSDAVKSNIA